MTNLFALALIATVSNTLNTVRVCIAYADQYAVDHCLDGAFPTYVPTTKAVHVCATTGMSMQDKVIYKAMRLVCRRAGSRDAIKPRTPRNSAEVRAAITARDNGRSVEKVTMHHEAQVQGVSISTMLARKAQGSAQKAINAVRALARAIEPKKAPVVHTPVVHIPNTKVRAPKRVRVYHMMHTVESVAQRTAEREELALLEAQYQALLASYKTDKEIARARRAAQRKVWIQLRAEKIARMCSSAWYNKGIWVDPALAEACNDACYEIRVSAYTELCALVGVAA